MPDPFAKYENTFASLRCGKVEAHTRPHKPVLLLALLDLLESGRIVENRVDLSPELLEHFNRYFEIVKARDDSPTPINPFFFLRGDKFWHHRPRPGMEKAYRYMRGPRGIRALNEVIEYAYLDDELYEILNDPGCREKLRRTIIGRYFAEHTQALNKLIREERQIGQHERFLKDLPGDRVSEKRAPKVNDRVRDTAFSRVVRDIYDYRCAACGLRIILDSGISIVDAAHLIPFSESHDDNPRNGMALCKNHHWAMDRFLIAPAPDHRWHVSRSLDDRIEGQRDLLDLKYRTILLPRDTRYSPKKDSLEWRQVRLLRTD